MRLLITALALLLTACTTHTIDRPEVVVISRVVETLPEWCPERALACAERFEAACYVYVRADIYPRCVEHEMRHCHEGLWHEGPSVEGC